MAVSLSFPRLAPVEVLKLDFAPSFSHLRSSTSPGSRLYSPSLTLASSPTPRDTSKLVQDRRNQSLHFNPTSSRTPLRIVRPVQSDLYRSVRHPFTSAFLHTDPSSSPTAGEPVAPRQSNNERSPEAQKPYWSQHERV